MNLTRRKIGAIALIVAGVGAFLVPFLLHTTSPSPSSSNNNNNNNNNNNGGNNNANVKDVTTSTVECSPSTIASGGSSSCTATVPDMTKSSNTPTGTVNFATSDPNVGTVSTSCTLTAGTCTANFSGVSDGTVKVTGTYVGDSTHDGSSGTSTIVVSTHSGNGGNDGDSGGTTGSCNETKSHDSDDASDPGSSTSHPDKDNQADSRTGDSPEGRAYGYWKNQFDTTISLVKSMGTHNPAFQSHHSTDTDNDTVHSHNNHSDSDSSTGADPSCTDTDSEQDD